jgi:hypothetical protein
MAERIVTRHGVKGHIETVKAYEKFVPEKYDTGKKGKKR